MICSTVEVGVAVLRMDGTDERSATTSVEWHKVCVAKCGRVCGDLSNMYQVLCSALVAQGRANEDVKRA